MSYALRDFGSYTVGGRIEEVTAGTPKSVQFTRTATYTYDPRGQFAVEHAYVQYFVPEHRNTAPPVVLIHGGGMTGSCWETTPDGRPGWLNLLVQRGFEVHVVDNVERGRSGFAPGLWQGEPILRSMQEAWVLFRLGTADGFATRTAFENQQFPTSHFEEFSQIFVPRWLTTTPLHTSAVLAVLRKTGPAIVICHSQGGEITFDAHAKEAHLFERIIALEPSGFPSDAVDLKDTPVTIVAGDFMDTAPHWVDRMAGWTDLASGAEALDFVHGDDLSPGHSHMLMMDRDHEKLLDLVLSRSNLT